VAAGAAESRSNGGHMNKRFIPRGPKALLKNDVVYIEAPDHAAAYRNSSAETGGKTPYHI
jgi:hypothetical protein